MQRPTDSPAEAWDRLVESALATTSGAPSRPRPSASVKLPLRPPGAERRHQPRVERTLAQIDPALRQTIRALVAGESPWPLFLCGAPGTGKTCAALCLLDHAGGEYLTVSGLCSKLIQAQQGRLEWSKEGRGGTLWPEHVWNQIGAAPLVVLDEMGCRDKVSDAHYEAVKQVIDDRYCKPLVVISNLALAEVSKVYDDRVFSRLAAGTVVEVAGDDRRLA
jgi:DNA replication protein DnaC